jgi:hypothetical protein
MGLGITKVKRGFMVLGIYDCPEGGGRGWGRLAVTPGGYLPIPWLKDGTEPVAPPTWDDGLT